MGHLDLLDFIAQGILNLIVTPTLGSVTLHDKFLVHPHSFYFLDLIQIQRQCLVIDSSWIISPKITFVKCEPSTIQILKAEVVILFT